MSGYYLFLLSLVCSLPWSVARDTTNVSGDPGKPECPCLDTTSLLAKGSNCFLPNSNSTEPGVYVDTIAGATCYPLSYGANICAAHDVAYDPACKVRDGVDTIPAYCDNQWCYVDPERCRLSENDLYFRSSYGFNLPDLIYYSYTTCGATAEDWLETDTTQIFVKHNRTLRVVMHSSMWPVHFKTTMQNGNKVHAQPQGDEYYNDSLPFQGWAVEYFDKVVQLSNVKGVDYVSTSKGSKTKGYASIWTQAVTDIQVGISDLALSSYWVTTERLYLTPFTVPVGIDTMKLWIPQPKDKNDSFRENAKKLLLPFSTGLWLAIITTVVLFGILSALLSPRQYQKDKFSGRHKRAKTKLQTVANATYSSVLDIMGGAVVYDVNASASKKLIDMGFAIFVFVVVSAYTANLAAFLTLSASGKYLASIEEAITKNIPLCASEVLKLELKDRYPTANWVFTDGATQGLIKAYDKELCSAVVHGWVDVRGNPGQQALFCERELVRVGNTLLEKPIAFPANKDIVGGISHWIAAAEMEGVRYMDFLESTDPVCNMEIVMNSNEDGGKPELGLSNMVLPFCIFGLSSICALLISAWKLLSASSSSSCRNNDKWKGGAQIELKEGPLEMRVPSHFANLDSHAVKDLENTMEELHHYQQVLLSKIKHTAGIIDKTGRIYPAGDEEP